MEIRILQDAEEWDRLLLRFPYNHPLQSYEWGMVKSHFGWQAHPCLLEEGGSPMGMALILTKRWGFLPWKVMYVPRGPVLDYGDEGAIESVLSFIEAKAREEKAIFAKIDPEMPEGHPLEEILRKRGWRYSREQIQFRSTLLLDLHPSEDELLRRMKQKTRYNIRLAGRKGVQVKEGSLSDLPLFYRMYRITSRRNGFPIRPYRYYERVWRTFLEKGMAYLLIAEHEGQPLAGVLIIRLGGKAIYMYGASTNKKRNLMPNHLLQWEAIRRARALGCTTYDMWGAPDNPNPSDPMWGVYRFKEGFGGRFVRYIGAYDFVVSPQWYFLYHRVIPAYLAFLRRLALSPSLRRIRGRSCGQRRNRCPQERLPFQGKIPLFM